MPSSLYLFLTAYRSLNNLSASLLPQPLPSPIVRSRVHSVLARCASSCAPAPSRNVICERNPRKTEVSFRLFAGLWQHRRRPSAQRPLVVSNFLRHSASGPSAITCAWRCIFISSSIYHTLSSPSLSFHFLPAFLLLLTFYVNLFAFFSPVPFHILHAILCCYIYLCSLFLSPVLTFLTFSDHVSRTVYS